MYFDFRKHDIQKDDAKLPDGICVIDSEFMIAATYHKTNQSVTKVEGMLPGNIF